MKKVSVLSVFLLIGIFLFSLSLMSATLQTVYTWSSPPPNELKLSGGQEHTWYFGKTYNVRQVTINWQDSNTGRHGDIYLGSSLIAGNLDVSSTPVVLSTNKDASYLRIVGDSKGSNADIRITGITIVADVYTPPAPAFSNEGGGDHSWDDWVISSDTKISGVHTNINNFIVNPSVEAKVRGYDGTDYGFLEIHANNIYINGTLGASGSGYFGGNGGRGGYGAVYDSSCPSDHPLAGSRGSGPFSGAGGAAGVVGTWADEASRLGYPGTSGKNGGYKTLEGQGDISTDESLSMGSGGGGAGGGAGGCRYLYSNGAGGGGGGAGNSGGGYIKLYANNNLLILGNLSAKGFASSTGNGASGANSPLNIGGSGGTYSSSGLSNGGAAGTGISNQAYYGSPGGKGGAGAGGGILLNATNVKVTGIIDNRGGNAQTSNGGTIKIFSTNPPSLVSSNLFYGRLYAPSSCPPEGCQTIACTSNANCSDEDPNTLDVCTNPGTTSSSCSNLPNMCSQNSQCGNSFYGNSYCLSNNVYLNYIEFTCNNPGTLESSCSNSSTSILNQTCNDYCLAGNCLDFTCHNNSECNDNDTSTIDTCNNQSTISSTCSNTLDLASNSNSIGFSQLTTSSSNNGLFLRYEGSNLVFINNISGNSQLQNIQIIQSNASTTLNYIIVKNLSLQNNQKKDIYLPRRNITSNAVCIIDKEITDSLDVADCFKLKCGTTVGNYSCAITNNVFITSGLKYSAIIETRLYCGDGTCYSDETCSTCASDCGQCPNNGGNNNNNNPEYNFTADNTPQQPPVNNTGDNSSSNNSTMALWAKILVIGVICVAILFFIVLYLILKFPDRKKIKALKAGLERLEALVKAGNMQGAGKVYFEVKAIYDSLEDKSQATWAYTKLQEIGKRLNFR